MRADIDDQFVPVASRAGNPLIKLLLAVAILAGLLLFWYWGEKQVPAEPPSATIPVALPAPQAKIPVTPDIPRRPEVVSPEVAATVTPVEVSGPEPSPAPLTPQQSDEILRQQLALTGTDSLLQGLASKDHPLDVGAALLDGLGRGNILRKMLPTGAPQQAFAVVKEGDTLYMSPASYGRFDNYVASIAALNPNTLANSFHTLRPFLERTYDRLGLNSDDVDNAVIRVLDVIVATPEIVGPIALRRKSVMYLYADPALESLPSVQKQLLRMGPDNIRRIKHLAQALRENLLAQ